MTFKLKELRERLCISQSELSRKTGISRTTIWRMENKEAPVIMTDTLFKLADALNCEVEDLFLH